jgi:hypothetical protein
MSDFFTKKEIMQDLTSLYLHKSNGLARNINPTIVLMVYSMIYEAAKVYSKSLRAKITDIAVVIP